MQSVQPWLCSKGLGQSSVPAKPLSRYRIAGLTRSFEKDWSPGPTEMSRAGVPDKPFPSAASVTGKASSHRGTRAPAFPSSLPVTLHRCYLPTRGEAKRKTTSILSRPLTRVSLLVASSRCLPGRSPTYIYLRENEVAFLAHDDSLLSSCPFSLPAQSPPQPLLPRSLRSLRSHCCATADAAVYHFPGRLAALVF